MLGMLAAPEYFMVEAYDEWRKACRLVTELSGTFSNS